MARGLTGVVLSDQIRLEGWDPDGDAYVVFQRPSRWEEEQLDKMQAQSVLEFDTDEQGRVTQRDRVPFSVLESEMVFMSLVECNIPDEETGEPVFKPGRTCRAPRKNVTQRVREGFFKVWYRPDFPPDLAQEIVEKLQEWHPPFNWRNPMEGND